MNPIASLMVLLSAICPCTDAQKTNDTDATTFAELNYTIIDSDDSLAIVDSGTVTKNDTNGNISKSKTMPFRKDTTKQKDSRPAPSPKRDKHSPRETSSESRDHLDSEHDSKHGSEHNGHTKDLKHLKDHTPNSNHTHTYSASANTEYNDQKQALDKKYEYMFTLKQELSDSHKKTDLLLDEYHALKKSYNHELKSIVANWVTGSLV